MTVVLEQGGFGRQAAAVTRRVFDGLAGSQSTMSRPFRAPAGNVEPREVLKRHCVVNMGCEHRR